MGVSKGDSDKGDLGPDTYNYGWLVGVSASSKYDRLQRFI